MRSGTTSWFEWRISAWAPYTRHCADEKTSPFAQYRQMMTIVVSHDAA